MSNLKAFIAGVVLTLAIMALTCLLLNASYGQPTIGIGRESVISVKAQEGQTVRFFITTE